MTQGELEQIPLGLQRTMSELEIRIMTDIVRRIENNGFSGASADWQINRLKQLGMAQKEIERYIQDALKDSDVKIDEIFSDKVYEEYYGHGRAYQNNRVEQIPYEENEQLQQLVEGLRRQTEEEFRNMTGSLGFAIRDPSGKIQYSPLRQFYESTLDSAMMDIHSGAFDYQTVLNRVISQMTNSGLRWIDYDSGWHNRVDVAARRAVMTGFRQIQGKINEQVANELNTDMYEVSYHVGARPEHQEWQGRVYSMDELVSICGLGDVTGLHGANCYHDYKAFPPGSVRTYTDEQLDRMNAEENKPKTFNGREYTTYEGLQMQRKMETAMRATRQQIHLMKEGKADEQAIIAKKAKYQGQMQTYKAFSQKLKLPEQKERILQDGLKGRFLPTQGELSNNQKINKERREISEGQSYRAIKRGEEGKFLYNSRISINSNRIMTYTENIYVDQDTTIKPRALHQIIQNNKEAIKEYGLTLEKLPKTVITSVEKIGSLGKYDAVNNILFYADCVIDQEVMRQYGGLRSTEYHEIWHLKQAENYRKSGKKITEETKGKYIQELCNTCKKRLDRVGVTEYNVIKISDYAKLNWEIGRYDEVEAEYMRVMKTRR